MDARVFESGRIKDGGSVASMWVKRVQNIDETCTKRDDKNQSHFVYADSTLTLHFV
jgi:hypothetical protein